MMPTAVGFVWIWLNLLHLRHWLDLRRWNWDDGRRNHHGHHVRCGEMMIWRNNHFVDPQIVMEVEQLIYYEFIRIF